MRHANGVSPVMRRCLPGILTSFSVMALVTLSAVAASVPIAPMADAASPAFVASQAPVPSNAGASPAVALSQSACPNSNTCVAVGSYDDTSGAQEPLIETYSSGLWVPNEGALPANAGASPEAGLDAVSCATSGSCVAIGSYLDSNGYQQPLVDILASGTWTPSEAPLPANAARNPDAQLTAISCSSTSCVAVGSYNANDPNVEQPPLIETLSGGAWMPSEASLPPSAGSGTLNGVSCPTDGSCVAVGVYNVLTTASGLVIEDTLPLVDTLSSGTWAVSEGAIPARADTNTLNAETVEFLGDSCDPTGLCHAVGTYADSTGNQMPLVESLSGGSWTVGTPVLPSDADTTGTFASISAVSCRPGEPCVAVGDYLDSSGHQQSFVEDLSGPWAPSAAALPPGANANPSATLNGVTCSTSVSVPMPTGTSTTTTSTSVPAAAPTTTSTSVPASTSPSTSTVPTTVPTPTTPTTTPTTTTTPAPTTTTPTTTTPPTPSPTETTCGTVGSYQDANGATQGVIGLSSSPGAGSN